LSAFTTEEIEYLGSQRLVFTALAAVGVGIFHPLPGPGAPTKGGKDGGGGPPGDCHDPGDRAPWHAVHSVAQLRTGRARKLLRRSGR
jgi:hypothetical protein